MEEKELNLVELLKGCEGETFYSRAYGEVALNEIVRDYRPNAPEIKVYTPDPQSDRVWFLRDGRKHRNGKVDLYPSEDLLKKYPFDGRAAWQEWSEARKPKHYLKVYIEGFQDGTLSMPDVRITEWLKFRTIDEVKQAAEGIREYLMNFHKQHAEQ